MVEIKTALISQRLGMTL